MALWCRNGAIVIAFSNVRTKIVVSTQIMAIQPTADPVFRCIMLRFRSKQNSLNALDPAKRLEEFQSRQGGTDTLQWLRYRKVATERAWQNWSCSFGRRVDVHCKKCSLHERHESVVDPPEIGRVPTENKANPSMMKPIINRLLRLYSA